MSAFQLLRRQSASVRRPSAFSTPSVIASALLAISLSGCGSTAQDQHALPSPIEALIVQHRERDPAEAARLHGRDVYEHYCQICHGAEARGNGFNAAMLNPPPRDFTDASFWKQTNEEYLLTVISQGGKAVGKSVLMPKWSATLRDQQIHAVIAYLKEVPKTAARAKEDGQPKESGTSE